MSRFWRRGTLALLLAVPVAAITFPVPQRLAQRFRGPVVRVRGIEGLDEHVQDGKLSLRLKDFIALVLKNSTDIQITRLDVLTAADSILSAKSPFDPQLTLGTGSIRSFSPQFNQTGGAETLSSLSGTTFANFSQTLSTGQVVNAGINVNRSSSNSQFVFFNPSLFSSLNLSITQPLLQGRKNLQMQTPLKIARTQLLITSEQSETRIADSVTIAARQYWDAIQARDSIKVQQQALDLAQKSYERDKLSLELGALPKLDILQSQSQVAQRKLDLIQPQYAYLGTLDGLRRLVGADLDPRTRNMDLVLDDDPASLPMSPLGQVDETIADALRKRPELSSARRRSSIDDLNARVARDSLLPRLDLSAIGGSSGLGGNQIPVSGPLGSGPSAFIPGGLGDALHQLFSFGAPVYGFSLQITVPVRGSAAQASLADALVSKARDQYQERQLEQQVIQEVKGATNQLEMANAQIEAARIARELAQRNVEAEQQKYELGSITVFEVFDAQNRLATLEASLLGAYTGYQKALISYKRATWSLLDGLGIIVETPVVK